MDVDSNSGSKLPVPLMASVVVENLPGITATVVLLTTLFPKPFSYLAPVGDSLALILMQVFFAVIGASGSVCNVIGMAPSIFMFALVIIHLAVILGFGKLFCFDLKLLLEALQQPVEWQQPRGGTP
ncbi:LOW QUALITY PROTEIN: Protein of unknown function DUF819 [Dillenia turbinata]|uniref:Uncharacterized protein n=1 Tax=Dillenia turbinata TaxID=194707 RepID=A0AAN8V927_9MAGN